MDPMERPSDRKNESLIPVSTPIQTTVSGFLNDFAYAQPTRILLPSGLTVTVPAILLVCILCSECLLVLTGIEKRCPFAKGSDSVMAYGIAVSVDGSIFINRLSKGIASLLT